MVRHFIPIVFYERFVCQNAMVTAQDIDAGNFSRIHDGLVKFVFFVTFSLLLFFTTGIGNAQSQYFSFDFKRTYLTTALDRIQTETGVSISAPLAAMKGQIINKSYHHARIESILSDMFHGKNYAIVWVYQKKQLIRVNIQLADGIADEQYDKSSAPVALFPSTSNANSENQADKVGSDAPRRADDVMHHRVRGKNEYAGPIPPNPEKFKGLELPPMPQGMPLVGN